MSDQIMIKTGHEESQLLTDETVASSVDPKSGGKSEIVFRRARPFFFI